jgi:uncharacterized LabA/DUF88 family protein
MDDLLSSQGSTIATAFLPALQRPVWVEQKRLAAFIEGANLLNGARSLGVEIDFGKLKGYLKNGYSLAGARFYTGIDKTWLGQKWFHSNLLKLGYRIVDREIKRLPNGVVKANFDADIAWDMRDLVDEYDVAVLVSGDGDLIGTVEKLQERGVFVKAIALGSMTDSRLRRVVNEYIDLAEIQNLICSQRR